VLPEAQNWDGLEQYVSEHYPRRDGITTHVIASSKSHCGWEFQKTGRDIWGDIAHGRPSFRHDQSPLAGRDDIDYLGQDSANVLIGNGKTVLRLFHPDGSYGYSIEHKLRRLVEAIKGGDKPHIFCVGHYHQAVYARIRNVATFAVPGCQWPTRFFRRWGKEPVVGALMLTIQLDNDGSLRALDTKWLYDYFVSDTPHAD